MRRALSCAGTAWRPLRVLWRRHGRCCCARPVFPAHATGYAVDERSGLEDAYVVRSRHAHAWARAWVGGRWVDIDTTPPDWIAEESRQAPFWQRSSPTLRAWAGFR